MLPELAPNQIPTTSRAAPTMGQPDVYPFVLSPPVIRKLGFIHDLVNGER
jgi:hypothetical protein